MTITMNGVPAAATTVEAAARMLAAAHPATAAVNGVEIDTDGGMEYLRCIDQVASAMAAGDWYWLDGSAYCPACVECESPAIDADDPHIQRGGAVSVCTCCRTNYNA